MKNTTFNLIIFSFSIFLLNACNKEDLQKYGSKDNIYLNYKLSDGKQDTTTLTYSFAENPSMASDTIWVPVIISGQRAQRDRTFRLQKVDSMSTAKAEIHFEPLADSYTMPADSGTVKIPLIIKNIDPALANNSVKLTIRVAGGEDFNTDLPLNMRSRTIQYSARLEQPDWWMYWMGNLGLYSRTKHQLFLIGSGSKSLVNMSKPEAYLEIPRSLYYIDNFKKFCADPFAWVSRNPEKGYVLTKRTDGTQDYDFYFSGSPEKKFHVKYYPQVSRYFFIDDNGQQIIIN